MRRLLPILALFAGCADTTPPPERQTVVVPAQRPQTTPESRGQVVVPARRPVMDSTEQPQVINVRNLRAGRIYARAIHAREVKAKNARIGRWIEVQGNERDREWDSRSGDLDLPEIRIDTIYARVVEADFIQADEVHSRHLDVR